MKQVTANKGVIVAMLLDMMCYSYYFLNHNIVGNLMIIGFRSHLKEKDAW